MSSAPLPECKLWEVAPAAECGQPETLLWADIREQGLAATKAILIIDIGVAR